MASANANTDASSSTKRASRWSAFISRCLAVRWALQIHSPNKFIPVQQWKAEVAILTLDGGQVTFNLIVILKERSEPVALNDAIVERRKYHQTVFHSGHGTLQRTGFNQEYITTTQLYLLQLMLSQPFNHQVLHCCTQGKRSCCVTICSACSATPGIRVFMCDGNTRSVKS